MQFIQNNEQPSLSYTHVTGNRFCKQRNHTTIRQSFRGYTLIETLISLALFMLLSAAAFHLMYTVRHGSNVALKQQDAIDQLSLAMDSLVANIQRSHTIALLTRSDDVLLRLDLHVGHPPTGHVYQITYNPSATSQALSYHILSFGGQPSVYGISDIRIKNVGNRRLDIKISSLEPQPMTIKGSVDIRHIIVRSAF